MAIDPQEKSAEVSAPPSSQENRTVENDSLLVALKRIVEAKKDRSFMDEVGALLQLLATLATLFFLIYGFVKFSNLDELAKTSETATKVVAARYDKAIRISIDGTLLVDIDKRTAKARKSLFSVDWRVDVKNLSKKPAVITVVGDKCSIATWSGQRNKEFFEHFGPPDIVRDSQVNWATAYRKVSSIDLDDDLIKRAFGTDYDKFLKDQKETIDRFANDQNEKIEVNKAGGSFLATLLEPDEGADDTEGFLVNASRSEHVACDSKLRLCYEDENGKGMCTDGETADSTHLWLAGSNQDQKN